MPTYDYECKSCGHRFEKFQSFSEKTLRKCPSCGKRTLERLIGTGGAILFKGQGFYTTDYRSEEYKARAKADKEAQSKGGESKSDSSSKESTPKSESTPSSGKSESKKEGGSKEKGGGGKGSRRA